MNNDRELLEQAAKAAGVIHTPERGIRWWNPLTDDGDALRLAVKLGIEIYPNDERVSTELDSGTWFCEEHVEEGQCPYAATRRAIVRAAAEIGKGTI